MWSSANCMPGLVMSMPVNSGTLSTSVAAATAMPNQRAALGRSLPKARVSRPPTIGSQMSRLSKGQEVTLRGPSASAPVAEQHREQGDQAQQHRECIVVEEAGLRAADDARGQVGRTRAGVDQAVDDVGV